MGTAGLPPQPTAAGVAQGKVYGDSTQPGVCERLDAQRKAARAPSHAPLNEPGLAPNVFWLPAGREEGVRRASTNVGVRPIGRTPGPDGTRWNQMGD